MGRDGIEARVRVLRGERMDLYGGRRENGHGSQAVERGSGGEPAHGANGFGLFVEVVDEAPVIA